MVLDSVVWVKFETIPIYYWDKVSSTGDLIHLLKDEKKVNKAILEQLSEIWIDLQQQYYDEFGFEPEVFNRVRTLEKLVKLNKDFIATRNEVLLNFIEIEEDKLKTTGNEYKFFQVVTAVEKYLGFPINPKEYPAIKWFYTLKEMAKKVDNG